MLTQKYLKSIMDYNPETGVFARIKINKKSLYLGSFGCPTAAHFAYCRAAKKYHGEFARTE